MRVLSQRSTDASRPGAARLPGLALGLLCLCAPSGCADPARDVDSSGIVVTDPAGRTVRLEQPARRVISMLPAVNEWVLAMGAADRLVARTDYDESPTLRSLPSVGGGLTPSLEWLAARQPDLVVAWPDAPSRSLVSRLEALGIAVYTAPVQTIAEGLEVAADVGRLLGVDSAAAAAITEVRAGLDSVRSSVAGRPRPGVLFLIGLDPLMAAGPGTFVAELVEAAGGRNVLADLGILWPQLSLEEVMRRAPDVVIVGTAAVNDPLARLRGRPGWRDVPAVRAGRVHAVDPDFVNRPGPRLDEAAARLAELIHPDGSP
jgi:ABC-type Fe3+-hydroxamate transport system substrate-binding protein